MKVTSCGFLIQSNGLYLLGHTTQPPSYLFNPHDSIWSIPKGIMDANETELDTAIRETMEETGIDVRDYYDVSKSELIYTVTIKHKTIKVYSLIDVDRKFVNLDFKCQSLIHNPNMPEMEGKPELDMFIWANKLQANRLVFKSLKPLFE